jgi:hypothetical protein
MNRSGESRYISSTGPNDEAIVRGVQWLVAEAGNAGNIGVIAVSVKANLENIANWSQLGSLFTQLRANGTVSVRGVTLKLVTRKDGQLHRFNGPILVIYGGQDLLDIVDGITGNASVLYIPWGDRDCDQWIQTWRATELGEPVAPDGQQSEPTSGAAFVALESLTRDVNLSSGIAHPSDRESAIRTLETLYHKHAPVAPEIICQQLIRLGWKPDDANEVKQLAEMIWAGRRPKKSTGRADDRLWDYWNSRAD